MGQPLRDMDKQQLLLEQILRVNALAAANDIAPLNLGPLARMSLSAAMKQVHDKNNEVIVALDGIVIPWSGPLKDPAAASVILNRSMDYTDSLSPASEGGGAPEWVPEGAKIHIDLVGGAPQGRAWVFGVGEVAVDTLLGADAVVDGFTGETSYNAANLTPDGYYTIFGAVAFIGAARTKILAGSTLVVGSKPVEDGAPFAAFVGTNVGNTLVVTVDVAAIESSPDVICGSIAGPFDTIEDIVNLVPGENTVAFTFTATRFECAANGSSPTSHALTSGDVGDPFDITAAGFALTTTAARSFTWYDALPSTAGLSALSETSVTNTAPHDMVLNTDSINPAWVVDQYTVSLSQEDWEGSGPGIGLIVTLATDDEGNPITTSVVSGLPSPYFNGDGGVVGVTSAEAPPPDDYVFTLRATDPGGLYVEQEFTITVTPGAISVFEGEDVTLSFDGISYPSITIVGNILLESIDFSNLTSVGGDLIVTDNEVLETLNLSALETVTGELRIRDAQITTLDLSELTSVAYLDLTDNSSLTSVDISGLTTVTIPTFVYFSGCALIEAQVDAILAKLVSLNGTGGTTNFALSDVNLSGGTNAPPSVAGLTSKATLEGRSCAVAVNS